MILKNSPSKYTNIFIKELNSPNIFMQIFDIKKSIVMQTSQPFFNHTHLSKQESTNPMLAIDHFCELFPPATCSIT